MNLALFINKLRRLLKVIGVRARFDYFEQKKCYIFSRKCGMCTPYNKFCFLPLITIEKAWDLEVPSLEPHLPGAWPIYAPVLLIGKAYL